MDKIDYTTHEISKICGVSITTIIDWIEQKKLLAYKTVGGHRRIKKEDLVSFLKTYNIPIPSNLVEKGSIRVLIVEDDINVIRFITRIVKKLKDEYEIAVAMDGFEAGKQVSTFKPDLVILDLMLPKIDGFEVCKNIRSDKVTKNIKILAVTGYDTEENKKRILACGANSYLIKPFEAKDLKEKIKDLLG